MVFLLTTSKSKPQSSTVCLRVAMLLSEPSMTNTAVLVTTLMLQSSIKARSLTALEIELAQAAQVIPDIIEVTLVLIVLSTGKTSSKLQENPASMMAAIILLMTCLLGTMTTAVFFNKSTEKFGASSSSLRFMLLSERALSMTSSTDLAQEAQVMPPIANKARYSAVDFSTTVSKVSSEEL